ncbi:hypothetical protein [Marinicella sp. W31]|uniref:hypothetical protein n=1 Tax=Marinicella sp. W31 TaxID=3023713 RepID=UPI003757FA47
MEKRKSIDSISQKEFLKKRRPEQFSDSVIKEEGSLDRAVLEHALSTLNKRSLELAFEAFSKKICEKVICPNLLEQTGPVAGGDGKVDTQTFPVSEQLKNLWYEGINHDSSKERWAFAISTQETWKTKCEKDVKNIKSTNRDYKKIFFVTNEYAHAGQRSELEDKLTQKYKIDIRILDLSWILDEVFKNKLEDLAIKTLSIGVSWKRVTDVGSNDYSKIRKLEDIDQRINTDINPQDIKLHQVNWFLDCAILSKELEKPDMETKGRFERACRIAEQYGMPNQLFESHYQFAWAAYWWFEDFILFCEQTKLCFETIRNSKDASLLAQFGNLLGVYQGYIKSNEVSRDDELESIRSEIKEINTAITQMDRFPSNSMLALANLEFLCLYEIDNVESSEDIFKRINNIINKANSLIGFPFRRIYELLLSLDSVFGEIESYELLLDSLTELSTKRDGELKGSLLLLKRGARRLDSNEPYQAIKLIGKSLPGLYKQETKNSVIKALHILSNAYLRVDLRWASRACLLIAPTLLDYDQSVSKLHVACYLEIAKSELLLGRIGHFFLWWKYANYLNSEIEESIITQDENDGFDKYLSQLILTSEFDDLNQFKHLPDLLENFNLPLSCYSLLYVLGHEDEIQEDKDSPLQDFFLQLRDHYEGYAPPINFLNQKCGELVGQAMGCKLVVTFPVKSPANELSETILSVFEGFCSTLMLEEAFVVENKILVNISIDSEDEVELSYEVDESGSNLLFDITVSTFDIEAITSSEKEKISEWLTDFTLNLFSRIFQFNDHEKTIKTIIGEHRALDRSISFGICLTSQQNLLGHDYLNDIPNLMDNDVYREYNLIRTEEWDVKNPKINNNTFVSSPQFSKDKISNNQIDRERIPHSQIETNNLIKVRLWDKAEWLGVAFGFKGNLPILSLIFENYESGLSILKDLHSEIGDNDLKDRIRVTIIKGINKNSVADYRIYITENMRSESRKLKQMIARVHTMTPRTPQNLNVFLSEYNNIGCFLLSFISKAELQVPDLQRKHVLIQVNKLHVVDAWTIEENSMDVIALLPDDEPIIPDGIIDPPFLRALESKFS